MGFNPLNQVYVFNEMIIKDKVYLKKNDSFNPLNQVYVFNCFNWAINLYSVFRKF